MGTGKLVERKVIPIDGAPDWFVRLNGGTNKVVLTDVIDDRSAWKPIIEEYKAALRRRHEQEQQERREAFEVELERSRSASMVGDVFGGPAFTQEGFRAQEAQRAKDSAGAPRRAAEKEANLSSMAEGLAQKGWLDLTKEDLRVVYQNPDAFKGKGISFPGWFTKRMRANIDLKNKGARAAARLVSDVADKASPFEQIHDPQLIELAKKGLASQGETEEVQEAAKAGIIDARHIRHASARHGAKSAGHEEGEFEDFSVNATKHTIDTVPGGLKQPQPFGISGPQMPGLGTPEENINAQLDALQVHGKPAPQEMKDRVKEAWQWYVDNDWVDADTGRADPNNFIGTVLGKLGVSGMPEASSPFSHILRGDIKNAPALARQAADDWEATIGKRAKDVLESKYGLEGAARVVINVGKDFYDNFSGLIGLIDWDVSDRRKAMVQALRNHLVDHRGGRPILGVEMELLHKEADSEFAANVFHGVGKGVSRVFTDTGKSFAGSPLNSLASMVGLARLINAGRIHLPGSKGAATKESASRFLSDLDAQLTLLPLAAKTVKKTAEIAGAGVGLVGKGIGKGIGKAAPYIVSEKTIDVAKRAKKAARNLFRGYTRLELGAKRARDVSQKVGDEYEALRSDIETKIDEGKTELEATKEAFPGASNNAIDIYVATRLENSLLNNGADEAGAAHITNRISDKRGALEAYLNDDVVALKEHIPDDLLAEAGVKPTFNPKGMRKTESPKHTTMELDSVILNKRFDDNIDSLRKAGRDAEADALLKARARIRARLNKGTMRLENPLIRPESEGGTPVTHKPNKGINNQALLAALVEEADGRPVRVTVLADEVSQFEGPLVGSKGIIDLIPQSWRTRLPIYRNFSTSKAPQMLEAFKEGKARDYALYLKRVKKKSQTEGAMTSDNKAAFNELEEGFLQATELTPEQFYGETRLGGLAANVNDLVEELVVRRSSRVPGAPGGIPALHGVLRPSEPVTTGMRPLPTAEPPAGRPFEVDPGMTAREVEALKWKESPGMRSAIEAMEAERMAEARAVPEGVPTETPATKTSPSSGEALARAERGEPVFTVDEQVSLLDDMLGRASRMDSAEAVKAINNRQAIVDRVRKEMLSDQMRRELEASDAIANGGEWHKRSTPQVFSGTVDEVKQRLIDNHPDRGRKFVDTMDLQKPNSNARKWMGLSKDKDLTVPSYVNDGFDFLDKHTMTGSPNHLQKATSFLKRVFTTRNPMTYVNNFGANMFLRAQVDGRFGQEGLVLAMGDIKDYISGNKKNISKANLEMLDIMDERGIFTSTILSSEIMDKGLSRVPLEIIGEMMSDKGVSGLAKRRIDSYNRMLRGEEKAYNMADPMFKVDHVYHQSKRFMDDLDEGLLPGQHIDVVTDKGIVKRLYRTDEGYTRLGGRGRIRLGGPDGKVLSDADIRRIATEKSIASANALYFDYMDVPKIIDLLRTSGLDAILLNPFFTWNWKAMYVPLVKRGLAREVISGSNNYWTNSKHFQAVRARGMLGAEFKRQLLLQTVGAAGRTEMARSQDLRKILSRYDYTSYYRGVINFGSNESYMFGTSGLDMSGANSPLSALIGSHIPERHRDVTELTMPTKDASDLVWAKLSEGDNSRAISFLSERLEENPDYLDEMILKVRSSFPIFDYDSIESIGTAVGAGKSFLSQLVGQLKGREDRTTADTLGTYLSLVLMASRGFGRLVEKGFDIVNGEADVGALAESIGYRKVSNSVFERSLRRMKKMWQERERDEYDLENIGKMPVGVQEDKLALKDIINALIANDMEAFRDKAIEEAEGSGLEIEYKGGLFTPKGKFVGTEVRQ